MTASKKTGGLAGVTAGQTKLWEGEVEPAIHPMICASFNPIETWFGSGLTVTE